MHWDIFCKVIDNHGDIGVCRRLSADLASRGETVRLWVDDGSALAWMAPQGCPGVRVTDWSSAATGFDPGDVVIEAFGCDLPADCVAAMAARTRATGQAPVWINLEYLSAEPYVERCHGLQSPHVSGLTKYFYYPGFTPATGGLLRERDLAERQSAFDRAAWLARQGIDWRGEFLVSLFCYEPEALDALLRQLAAGPQPTQLLVTPGRARHAVLGAQMRLQSPPTGHGALSISYLPHLSQMDFDHLLWTCDFNLVRGEDSLVRAVWAGKPFVWQLYPQNDGAHAPKLEAFLDRWLPPGGTSPHDAVRRFHRRWNGMSNEDLPVLPVPGWSDMAIARRTPLLAQNDLVSQLVGFVLKKS